MAKLPEIASLWIGGQLSWLEQLCLKSFADAGHHITLYSYAPITNIPEGVHAGDASDIFPGEPMYKHARTGSPAIHADIWRLQLLKKTSKIWVDADIYCYRPFDYKSRFVFGWEKPGLVCNAVLGLPKTSKTLKALLQFFQDEYAIGPWLNDDLQAELRREKDAGTPVHMTQQNWGFTGPAAVTHFLQQTGEIEHAQPVEAFYPISFKDRNQLIISRFKPEENLSDATRGVHFWARRMKPRLEEKENNTPRRGSFMDKLLDKHGVNPGAAPIPAKIVKKHAQADEPGFREMIGTMALAGDMSVDQLSRKFLLEKKFIKDCMQEFPAKPTRGQGSMLDISKFDYSMFDDQDLLNFILQRSEILVDVPKPGRLIKAWSDGSTAGLDAIVTNHGAILAERATRVIGTEFDALMPVLETIPNKSIADIGCGYAIFDLFMHQAFQSRLVLIDLEENDQKHFGYTDEGSAYSKLSKAVEFLTKNSVDANSVERLNPSKNDIMSVDSVDIAVSFLACGFHFPVDVYLEFFGQKVNSGGHIFLDLRRSSFDEQANKLRKIGELSVLQEIGKQIRVMVKRA
ncbi:MAG: hypothetical protein L3J36_05835 [Rhodobacteraceae bacterium]|nr:hypothetical protein [Paracoccaceae bacterium]